jgi:hypothetical protein
MKRTHAGRPPLDDEDPSGHVTLTLPSKQLDAFCKRALREDVSVPEIIRRDLFEKKPPPRIKT